ncbi:tectonin beta-propeller repeat-containing protein [Sitophilus oryzae]|uniref:Tectonin beta-propeller repeat-containing protein n=1 Tax=Sitophilus oryzae TaxID=7048 RepID=A0A6J2XK84_SITOR|nr:tectonin beta-propeller repeat-containing protein [Sitophilus oryzae]XP_030751065.1 tectonin beta-propeller repeat-containing protein [Sitophilus oryzae]
MPSSLLFGINNEGRVYTLSTSGSMWRELPYNGQEFKKLSGVPHFLWGLGGDHQIYVYVHGLDIPIRIREESYENERWLPIEGFTSRLLPTDRFHFSNADGTADRSIDRIRLPSMAWQWEGDWQLELTLDGQPLDHNGWTYAVDFPSCYYSKKQWKSCVRRRLWVRTAKYCAMNTWCAIAPLHKDATSEPFIDISIGGQNVIGADPSTMLVWAVTSHNRVMFRSEVSTKLPEGTRWHHIQVPTGCEVGSISVGPSGLVWSSLLDGRALVRVGVSRETLQGDMWVEVRSPGDNLRITQLSVGNTSVWAVTQDNKIWFRKRMKREESSLSEEELAVGSGWIEMVGKMCHISATSNDQVFAVGAHDRVIYYRMGVCQEDLTGKRWRAIRAPLQVSRASSNASLGRDRFHRSLNQITSRPSSMIEQPNFSEFEEQSHSAPLAPTSLPTGDYKFETRLRNPKAWSPVHSVGSIVGTEVHPDADESIWNENSRDSCIFAEDEELEWAEYDTPWSWVEAGTCLMDISQFPNWFSESNDSAIQEEFGQSWRTNILNDLKTRLPDQDIYSLYESAIETTSWIHVGEARVNLNSQNFVDCILQLEWLQITGTLTILNSDGATTMHSFPLSDITCVQLTSDPGNSRLSLFTPRNNPAVVVLQFVSDVILEEWQSHFAITCGKLRDAQGRPSDESIWAVTNLGDIFVWDPTQLERNQLREDDFYIQKFDLRGKECPIKVALHVGCIPGTVLTLTGCIGDEAERLGINLEAPYTYKKNHKAFTELENMCLHINPRFSENCVVRNSMVDGKWGKEERDGKMPFSRSQEFNIRIESTEDAFIIFVNTEKYTTFRHRLPPHSACFLHLWGKMQPFKLIIRSPVLIVDPLEVYWRQLGGHLRRVESCNAGVIWGIGYDHTAWVYTEGWGGSFYGTLDSHNVYPMTDCQDYRVYENQRWNPVTGYTSSCLPTDRHMWSDASGRQKRIKEQVKLPTVHWQWISDWMVDFHVPGGVDKEGWQYAVDFPASYHSNKQFTDLVRRRRWYRRCVIASVGPWQELGHTKLLDVSLEPVNDNSNSEVSVWALASSGQVMFRVGTSRSNPTGHSWQHITTDQPFSSISCGPFNQVWAVGKKGCAYLRVGIKEDKLEGERWVCVEPPVGAQLKQVSVNSAGIWAIDALGRLNVRKEVSESFPEGTHWQSIYSSDLPVLNSASHTQSFKQVSVSKTDVWAVTNVGSVLRRIGLSTQNPGGSGWDIGITGNWQHISVRAFR